MLHAPFLQEGNGSTKSDEFTHARHVDAITIGVPYLRRGGDDDDLFRVEPVQNFDDALLECRAAHNAVVDDDQVVFASSQGSVCDIIHMCGKVVAGIALCNKGA